MPLGRDILSCIKSWLFIFLQSFFSFWVGCDPGYLILVNKQLNTKKKLTMSSEVQFLTDIFLMNVRNSNGFFPVGLNVQALLFLTFSWICPECNNCWPLTMCSKKRCRDLALPKACFQPIVFLIKSLFFAAIKWSPNFEMTQL